MRLRNVIGIWMLCFLANTANAQTAVIDQFLASLDGTEASAEAAVKKYCNAEVIANGMIPYGSSPKITEKIDNCVVVELTDGDEVNKYTLCEMNEKIILFETYYDEDEDEEEESDDEE